ncbi:MAG: ATP-binding protein [Ignavibacteria bacterium]|nr:ATP-binding protein [Ignavibacteria bacterium]
MFKTLQSKIILNFAALIIAIVTLLLISFNYIVVEQLKLKLAEELKTEINLIELGLLDVHENKLDEYLHNLDNFTRQLNYNLILQNNNQQELFKFYSDTSIINKDYDVLFLRKTGKYQIETRKYKDAEKTFLLVKKSVDIKLGDNQNQNLRYIIIETGLSGIENFSNNVRFKIIVAALILFVFGFFVIKYFSRIITSPVTKIIEALKEFSKTGSPQLISIEGGEEFKFLIESINNLMRKIEEDMNELRKLERYRSEFLGNVSHELRTPIFTIQSYLETLIEGGINDPEINIKYLKKALENLERLNRLLSDLIDISQIEAKQLRLSFRYFSINELLQKVIDDLKILADQKEINLVFDKDDNLKELAWGDKERLYQVFYNLIENSIRHNPPQTTVRVYYHKINSTLRVFVEDNGIGIPEEDLPRIFERFYRVNKERSRESGGTGLGLSIVKHIVEAHNSKIYCESKLNQGTKFYFDLKIA